ncbi:MAG: hypothetical protein AAFN10_26765 [Bacteroidota bacterium]
MPKLNTIVPRISPYLLPFGLPALLLGALSLLVLSPYFALHQSDLTTAITLDFVLTVPLLYLWLIRHKPISKLSVSPVLIISFLVASFLLPTSAQGLLQQLKVYALPLFELGILACLFYQVRRTVLAFRMEKGHSPDFFDSLKAACQKIFPARLSTLIATEAAVIYYGLNFSKITPSENAFTYHKKSGSLMMHGSFIGLIVLETIGLHFLLGLWSETAAWILSMIGLYTLLQLVGMIRAIPRRLIRFEDAQLVLPYGLLAEAKVPLKQIAHIEESRKSFPLEGLDRKLSPIGEFESHNFILHLQSPAILEGIYGTKRAFSKLGFFVDDTSRFKESLQANGITVI